MGIISLLIFSQTFSLLSEFCAFGPRVPGTPAHRNARDYIVRHLGNAVIDSFSSQGITFYNIIAELNQECKSRIGLATHWESRPFADREKDRAKRKKPIVGANDGGSGVAVLLALSDSLRKHPPNVGVDLIFFDGEDYGAEPSLLGSKRFAARCIKKYDYVILIDMIGDRDLRLYREGYSNKFFPQLVDSVWQLGRRLNSRIFRDEVKYYVSDDHMSLIETGIKAIDIIDFDYPYWHTLGDKPDKCSEASLDLILKLLMAVCYEWY